MQTPASGVLGDSGVHERVLKRRGSGTRQRRKHRPTTWAGLAFVAPLVAYFLVLYVYPLYENVSMSLHRFTRATFVTGKAPFVGFDIYREVLASPLFGHPVTAFPTRKMQVAAVVRF